MCSLIIRYRLLSASELFGDVRVANVSADRVDNVISNTNTSWKIREHARHVRLRPVFFFCIKRGYCCPYTMSIIKFSLFRWYVQEGHVSELTAKLTEALAQKNALEENYGGELERMRKDVLKLHQQHQDEVCQP